MIFLGVSRTGSMRACACVLVLSLLSSPLQSVADGAPFPDMQQSWFRYQESVAYLVSKGSIQGYPDGNFHPRDTVNRAEFLKLVFRSRGPAEPVAGECFSDVPADAWFAPYVCAAKRRDIVKGYEVGSRMLFKPEQPIIFAEAVKMTLLAYGSDVAAGAGERWYEPYVEWLDAQTILASSSYNPGDEITRERAADLIARFVQHDEDRVIGNLSEGCGKTPRLPYVTLTVGGVDRSYLFTHAKNATPRQPSPLIVAFHGRTNSNEQVRKYFGLERAADDYFIAYPAAIQNQNGTFSWSNPGDKASELRDIAFFDAIVKEVSTAYCIDMDRIYVVGHSLGAWFANSVACARGGAVRASATVGGSATISNCTGPTAAMIINNPKDALSPHTGAEKMRDIRVAENTCTPPTQSVEPSSLSCVQYTYCPENPVVFCPHTVDKERDGTYYPHTWPQGTAEAMVGFFDGLL